ncbi:MAG TPA: type II CAAX endopeptidase family protein [Terriglobia bacterium]|nr:type II CAAX endopeptidase family protein [Terriglobia bacterium]
MPLLPLFVDSRHEIRSGWKFVAYSTLLVFLFIVASLATGGLIYLLDPAFLLLARSDIRFLGLNAIVLFIPASVAFFIMARFVDRIPLAAFGITPHDRWLRDLSAGVALAVGMLGITIVGSFLFGKVQMQWNASVMAIPALATTVAVLLISALNEELVFRGYPLQVLLKGIGPWAAILLVSSIWALLHARNEGATVLSTLNTIIAGVFFSRAYMETRSIWLPYGIHIGWNVGTAVVLGVPVSGIETASLLKTQVSGPPSIVGGGYGPEDGLLGTVIFLAGAIVIRRMRIGKVSPQVQTALAAHADKVYIEEV